MFFFFLTKDYLVVLGWRRGVTVSQGGRLDVVLPCHPHLNSLTVSQVHCSGLLYSYDYRELLCAAGLNSVWFVHLMSMCVCVYQRVCVE